MGKKIKEAIYVNEVLTVQEVAKILRVNIYTIYELLKSGRLDGFKLTRRWRIRKQDLIMFMQKDT